MTDHERLVAELWKALDEVCDPELDQSVRSLGFVTGLTLNRGVVTVDMHLPTYWCAPNFAYMMLEDVDHALRQVAGVEDVNVRLWDHESSEAITLGVKNHQPFETAFGDQTQGDLSALRRLFKEKAFYARQNRVLDLLQESGVDLASFVPGTWGDLERTLQGSIHGKEALRRYRNMANEFRLACGQAGDPAVVTLDGQPVTAESLRQHRQRLRLITLNMEANGHICQGLFKVRYHLTDITGS